MIRQDDFAAKFRVSVEELEFYAMMGLLYPQRLDDHIAYDDRSTLRMHIIFKGKSMGYSIKEIRRIIGSIVEP